MCSWSYESGLWLQLWLRSIKFQSAVLLSTSLLRSTSRYAKPRFRGEKAIEKRETSQETTFALRPE